MPDIESRPIPSSFEPARSRGLASSDLMRRIASDLTPFQAVRAGLQIGRGRMKTAVELARIEDETILAEARVVARAKVQSITEQAERLLHAERLDCLAESALKHEETSRLVDLVKDEAAHTLFKDALNGASARYASGVVQRSGGSGS
jgi:F0F1-type ATP synthase membrane subunit b/b'